MFRHASRNRAYSLVWNEKQCAYVPAPEGSRARRKRSGGVAVVALLAAGNAFAIDPGAHPTGGAVVAGTATISQAGAVTSIAQATQRAVIDWQSFDIGSKSVVNFVQPNSSSVVMNQVLTQNPTQIAGTLNANGQVFVVNPSGVLFAPGAQVSAAGVLASTRTVSTEDFMAGRLVLSGNSTGTVVNRGSLSAAPGGYVVLVGAQVVNDGSITAPGGDVRLAAADQVTLKVDGAGLSMFQVDRGTLDALVSNKGVLRADGGRIYLTADALDALAKATVNNTGLIEALSVDNHHGVVELLGDARVGQVEVAGRIDVSSTAGRGGQVVVTAHDVALHDDSSIDASGAAGGGKVLVGGGWQGRDPSIANASTVTMAADARIDVGARGAGDGGTAVLWSEDRTQFAGTIAARGGAAAGQGGRVETSSHDNLQALGSVDAAAAHGAAGLWLLDPNNVVIAASGASGTPYTGSTYTPATDSVILASSIVNTLNAGSSVTVTTGSTGTSAGNITVNAPIVITGTSSNATTLTLNAANDINVNALIANNASTYYNRLNVVLTPGSSGSVAFSSAGHVATGGGNFYVGSVSGAGQAEAVAQKGQNFTMAAGSSIDVAGGMLDVQVNGAIAIPANSLVNTAGAAYYNDGYTQSLIGSLVRLHGAGITSSNTSATTPDIVTTATTTLQADAIGSSVNPIKISAGSDQDYARLNVINSVGSSYVNEIENQAFSTIAVSVGSQASSVQDIRILEDFGGNGHSGVGHILLNTDDSGVLTIAAGDVRTAGANNSQKTNVEVNATSLTFADGSVNTGAAYFSASGVGMQGVALANNVADIASPDVRLSAANVGTRSNPVELSSGSTSSGGTLTVTNTGGSTFLKSVDNNFTTINLNHVKDSGTHSILFAGGDHLDYTSDGSNVVLPTLGGASDGQTFGMTTGMDGSRRNRNVVLTPLSGGAVFGDNSVNLGRGSIGVVIPRSNATGTIAAANAYDSESPVAQITAGNVSFSVQNDLTPSVTTIGAGGRDIQIAQGAGAANNTLSVSTQQGSVAIHELTPNHFKTISLSLGSASAAQSVAIDLAGPDDIAFSDSGSLVTVDATKVNVSANNRNFSLTTDSRSIQADGNSLGTGYYTLSAGNLLKLNGDIRTDGGAINLTGQNGVDLFKSVLVDSNVGHAGNGGGISVGANISSPTATVSSTGGSRTLTLDSSSTDAAGGSINFPSNVDNRAGAYLAGLTLKSSGATYARDGSIGIGSYGYGGVASSILLKGGFSSTGKSSLNNSFGITIDTEQGNSAAGGNITFAGADLIGYLYYGAAAFNASTGLAGANGGNVSLATQNISNVSPTLGSVTVDARGGNGGTAGDITLPALSTTTLYGALGTQAYYGRNITLNGDLTSPEKSIGLSGDVRLARSVTIATNASGGGSTGPVSITGAVSANAPGAALSIDTSTSSGNRGGVSIAGGAAAAGGFYVDSLDIRTSGSGGSNGAIALGPVATEGAQTYAGGTVSVSGGMSTNGGAIDLAGAAGLAIVGSAGSPFVIDTDRAGGTNAAGALRLGTLALNGSAALTIDTTADGGGANAPLVLNSVGLTTAFSSINVAAGTLTLAGTTNAAGTITAEARGAAADLIIASTGQVSTTTGSDIVLAAGRNFTNNRGTNGISQGEGGRYLVYSTDPAASLEGMSGYSKHYNQRYVAGSTPSYAGSGNWFLYSVAPVISVSTNGASVVYGSADPSSTLTAANYSGFIDSDTRSSLSGTQTLTLAEPEARSGSNNRPVGTYAYGLSGTLTDSLGYQYAPLAANLAVTPRALAVSGVAASNKVYDGNASATVGGTGATNAIAGDAVALDGSGASASFADKNVANGKPVTVAGYALGGSDAGNYSLAQPTGLVANITPKALAIAGSSVATKTYDGSTAAAVTPGTVSGLVGSETLTVGASGVFDNRNAGSGKNVDAVYLLGDGGLGGLASNYSLAGQTLTGASITAKTIAVTATGVDKVYDGTRAANATYASTGVVSNDDVTFGGAATFADKNAGVGKAVSVVGIGSSGQDAGNYVVGNSTASTTANIAVKAITVAATGVDKVYDGTTAATATLASAGVVSGDDVGFGGAASFADKNAGVGKAVSVGGIASSGADAGNYSLTGTSAATTATIAAKAITVAATGVDKVYDGTTAATATLAGTGVIAGDDVGFGGSANFADKNAGAAKAVNVIGIGKSGEDAGNYSVGNTSAATTANIATKAITVTATGVDKVYDGTVAVVANFAGSGVVADDVVSFGGIATLADKNVGVDKAVGVTGITASGTDGANYSVNGTAATTASVTRKAITVAATGVDKVYDGTSAATAVLASAGVISGDVVGFGGTASFADKNAGVGKAVSVASIGSSGADAGNYILNNTSAATTASIAAKAITVAATGVDKVYDGSTAATATYASNGVVPEDAVTFAGIAALADKNVGIGKAVGITGIAASGTDAGNYSVNGTAATTANVTAKAISVTATGVDKVYDGTTAVVATFASNGVVGDDVVRFAGSAALADKNVGIGKAVGVTGIAASGTDAANYSYNRTAATTADVTVRAITVDATGVDRVYDGGTAATALLASAGVVSGDAVAFGGTARFADKNVGVGKAVGVSEIGSSGADSGNYSLDNTSAATTASIAAKAITVAATGVGKVYDGTTAATATLASDGVVADDAVRFAGIATLADKNVGIGKAVGVTGSTASGADARNYLVDSTAATTADVTARAITVAATGVDRVYDGGTAATVLLASAGVVSGDAVGFGGTARFADKNVGVGKAVGVSEIGSSGADSGNYSLNNTSAATTATIAAKAITVAATGVGKVYDGTTAATATLASDGVVADDAVRFAGTATLADKNVGIGKAVGVTGISAGGADAANYVVNGTARTTADVTARAITVAATGIDKVYDGTTAASTTLASTGVIAGDTVSFGGTATLADKNVGIGKAVGVTGIAANGIDAGNYSVNATAGTTADVTAKAITVAATGIDRVYDGGTAATATLASAGVVAGDAVGFGGIASFADKNAGVGKAVSVGGIGSSGADAGNYSLNNTSAATTASIAAKAITVGATGVDKVYDGTTAATATLASAGVVPGDVVNFAGSAAYADRNAGIGKAVGVSDIGASGADAGNYRFSASLAATGNITPKPLAVALVGPVQRVSDGSTDATLTAGNYLISGVVAGDSLSITKTSGVYADGAEGAAKRVSVDLAGIDYLAGSATSLSNYSLITGQIAANVGLITGSPVAPVAPVAPVTPVTPVPPVSPVSPSSPSPAGVPLSALVSLPNLPNGIKLSGLPSTDGTALIAGTDELVDAVEAIGTTPSDATVQGALQASTVVNANTKEKVSTRRTFTISDGGMRLPAGVKGSEKDASQ